MSDQDRKDFEAWYSKRYWYKFHGVVSTWAHAAMCDAWDVWQAARAALAQQAVPPAAIVREDCGRKWADLRQDLPPGAPLYAAPLARQAVPPAAINNPYRGDTRRAYLATEYWNEGWNACRAAMLAAAPAAPQAEQQASAVKDGPTRWHDLNPPMLVLGRTYKTASGKKVRMVSISNAGTEYESMADEDGHHRYSRSHSRVIGRCTGSPIDAPLNILFDPPVQPNGEAEAAPQAEPAKCISAQPDAKRPHRPDNFCPDQRCGMLGQCLRNEQAERQPLTDEQAKRVCHVGPVYAPEGVVKRSPAAYRVELEAAMLRGLREGERAHGIGKDGA